MEGNVIDSWTSTERAHEVVGLVQGKPYKLVETSAPEGSSIAEPVLFVAKDGENVTIKEQITEGREITSENNKRKNIRIWNIFR